MAGQCLEFHRGGRGRNGWEGIMNVYIFIEDKVSKMDKCAYTLHFVCVDCEDAP